MDPVIGGAVIGGVSNIVGGLFGGGMSGRQAKKNREWQSRENQLGRDFQKEMWLKNAQWQEDMWNKNNKYNSASEQARRFREAGLNPALMMKEGTSGSAVSQMAAQPDSVQPYQSTSMPYDNSNYLPQVVGSLGEIGSNLYKNAADIREKNSRAKLAEIDAFTRAAENASKLKGTKLDNAMKQLQNTMYKDFTNSQINRNLQDIEASKAQTLFLKEQTAYQQIKNQYADKEIASNIASTMAHTELMIQEALTSGASARQLEQLTKTEVYRTIDTQYQAAKTQVEAQYKGEELKKQLALLDKKTEEAKENANRLSKQAQYISKDINNYNTKLWLNGIRDVGVGIGSIFSGVGNLLGNASGFFKK